ncbi:DNA cytosine methyltransferase [Aquisphaera insulae]|uniref:DNA cytosine methyltransferase n=1 Tax=Aquisphaera insulae TaxID=2712864 RepID=UPI0013EB9C3A|nr:DNA cytosine methyltransferase [Aquisphaera insulae]
MPQRNAGPVAIDLFAGAGGLSLGFELAGFSIALALEKASGAAATYRRNHPDAVLVEEDIRDIEPARCLADAGINLDDVDALVCGLPCQGFSESNRRTRNMDNPRNHLYADVLRFVAALRPKCVIVENVAGMRTMAGGAVIHRIVEACERQGYAMATFELNAADFGVPQFRRRLFIVGIRGPALTSPEPTHGTPSNPYVTVRQAIHDLPVLRTGCDVDRLRYRRVSELSSYQKRMRAESSRDQLVSGNWVTKNSPDVLERFRYVGRGQNWEVIPAHLMLNLRNPSLCHTGYYYRLQWDEPSKVVGNFRKNMLIHPSQNRTLSVREAARLQSFPDNYEFLGAKQVRQQQVADAVPPLLAKAVANVVIRGLGQSRLPTSSALARSA